MRLAERAAERERLCLHWGEWGSRGAGVERVFYYKSLEHLSMENTLERGYYGYTLHRIGLGGMLS